MLLCTQDNVSNNRAALQVHTGVACALLLWVLSVAGRVVGGGGLWYLLARLELVWPCVLFWLYRAHASSRTQHGFTLVSHTSLQLLCMHPQKACSTCAGRHLQYTTALLGVQGVSWADNGQRQQPGFRSALFMCGALSRHDVASKGSHPQAPQRGWPLRYAVKRAV